MRADRRARDRPLREAAVAENDGRVIVVAAQMPRTMAGIPLTRWDLLAAGAPVRDANDASRRIRMRGRSA